MTYPIIGIIAVTTPGGAICAQHLVQAAARNNLGSNHPEYYIHARPTQEYIDAVNLQDWDKVAFMVLESVRKLSSLGASLFIMPSNTPHFAWSLIEQGVLQLSAELEKPIYFLNLIEETVKECRSRGYKSVLLLGTAQTMQGDLYKSYLSNNNIVCHVPEAKDIRFIDNYIKEQLVKNQMDVEKNNELISIINQCHQNTYFDAVILGCTELPMILNPDILQQYPQWNSTIQLVDTTLLLAESAVINAIL